MHRVYVPKKKTRFCVLSRNGCCEFHVKLLRSEYCDSKPDQREKIKKRTLTQVPGTSYQNLFVLQNMFRKIPFSVIYHLSNFDSLMQSGINILINTFAHVCKPIHDVIIIPVSSDL